jgi:hypothetical protein
MSGRALGSQLRRESGQPCQEDALLTLQGTKYYKEDDLNKKS